MRKQRHLSALAGAIAVVAACSGDPFSARGSKPADTGGMPNSAGKHGAAVAGTGGGGEDSAGEGGDRAEAGAGPTDGGSPATGGTAPSLGGKAAVGGLGGGPPLPTFTMSRLIDDMEDGNATLLDSNGDWFVFKDTTNGTITPAKEEAFTMRALMPARGASKMAAAVTVSGFTDWGAAFGFDFSYRMDARQPTDLKEALGVRFWAKASKATTVLLQLPNADTDLLGGKCSGNANNACGAHWSKPFSVGTAWSETTIALADLKQELPGRHVPLFDKQHVYSIFFVIGPNEAVTVWVDDVALVH